MENTSETLPIPKREIAYYRQRQKNRVLEALSVFFAEEAERSGISRKDIADMLEKNPSQITRWLSGPSNLTLDTISDLLLTQEAEMDYRIVRFSERAKANFEHPLVAKLTPTNIRGDSLSSTRIPITHIDSQTTGTSTTDAKISGTTNPRLEYAE
jgi:transcriptional regulator with XRE-family HTH domain